MFVHLLDLKRSRDNRSNRTMPMLLETYVDTTSLTWLIYVTLAVNIVILCAGGTCVCSHCCAFANAVFHFVLFCLHTLQRVLTALPQAIEHLPEPAVNHYILDLRPEYGVDIKKMISDIVDALNKVSLYYPAPEKPTIKYRNLPRKLDVRGWRRKLNQRWEKKMKFIRGVLWHVKHKYVLSNESQNEVEANSQREDTVNNSYSSLRESHSEGFLLAPHRDEDADLHETTLQQGRPHKLTMFKAEPNGELIPHWE